MGRRERPLDVDAGPLQSFAGGLRDLRRQAGNPTYQAMAGRAYCSKSALAAAAKGDVLPSLAVALAYVQACGGSVTQWERRWRELAARLERDAAVPAGTDTPTVEGDATTGSADDAVPIVAARGPWPSLALPRGLLPEHVRGRTNLVRGLQQLIDTPDGRLHVLCGMGGCGKTTVALSVADHSAGRAAVWWITARDDAALTTGLIDLALALGTPPGAVRQAATGMRSLTDLVWRRLDATQQRWLLVIDNADEPDLLAPEGGQVRDGNGVTRGSRTGLMLVTTRVGDQATWGDNAVLHPVGMLDDVEGGQVLTDLAPGAGDAAQAAALSARLGGLPLALRAAGRYLSSADARLDQVTTFADYRRVVDDRFQALLGDTTASVGPRDVVMTTWELSLDWLARHGLPQSRTLMRLLGGLAPAPIPVSLLDRPALFESRLFIPGATAATAAQRTAAMVLARVNTWLRRPPPYSEQVHRRVVTALCGLGLLDLVEAGRTDDVTTCLTAHPLVTEVNAAWVAGDRALSRRVEHTVATLLAQTARGREAPDADEYRRWPLLAPHLLHALTRRVHPLPRQLTAALIDAATTTNQGLNHAGDYATADKLGSVTAAAAGRGLPVDHPVALMLRSQIANTLLNKGQHAEAENRYRDMLPDAIRVTGADSMLSLRIRHNLALTRAHAGARDETDTMFRDLLPDVERAMGADSQFAVLTRNNIADNLFRMGRYDQAAAEYRTTLPIVERAPGIYRELLFTRHGLAAVLSKQGHHEQAVAEFREVVALAEDKLAPDHPYTLRSRAGLAAALAAQGLTEQAEAEFQAALRVQERVLGTDHQMTLETRCAYADALAAQGHNPEAEAEYRTVVAARESALGPDHPDTLDARAAMARLASARH